MTGTPEIILKQQCSIGPDETIVYPALMRALERRGWSAKLWSTARAEVIEPWTLPSSWFLDRWASLWPGLEFEGADVEARMENSLELARWWPRVARLAKQHVPPGPTPVRRTLLRHLFVVSQHIVERPRLGRYVAWNPHCPHGGVALELARSAGLPTTTFERGFLPQTWMVDPGGLMGDSQLAELPLERLVEHGADAYEARGRAALASAAWGSFNRYRQDDLAPLPVTAGPRIAVLGSDDVTTGFWPIDHEDRRRTRPGFDSSFDLARRVASARPDATVLFKPHPSMQSDARMPVASESPNLEVVNGDFRSLIEWSQVCVTAGSTTGFVVMALARPLVLGAREVLSGKGIGYEAQHPEKLADAIDDALAQRTFAERRHRFEALVGWLRTHYLYGADEVDALASALLGERDPRI